MADTPGKSVSDEQDERAFAEWAARTGLPRDVADTPGNPLAAAQQEAASRMSGAWRRAIHMDTPDDLLAKARAGMGEWLDAKDRSDAEFEAAQRMYQGIYDLNRLLSSGAPLPSAWAVRASAHPYAGPLPFCGVPGHPDYAHGGHPEPAYSEYLSVLAARDAQIAEQGAEIARLTAELDSLRDAGVEHVTSEAALEAAMAADPGREDGVLLRETYGQRRAWTWKAATREWEQVT